MRLFKPKSIPGWFLTLLAAGWTFMEKWHTSEFIFKKLMPGKDMPTLTAIISHPLFPIGLMLIGLTWIWRTTRISPNVKKAKSLIQELYEELDDIAKDKWVNYNYQSIRPAIGKLTEWKDKAKRLLINIIGQSELDNFVEKIKYVENKDEYRNPNIGMIEAFYDEKEIYLKYLKDLLDSLEKYPELYGQKLYGSSNP